VAAVSAAPLPADNARHAIEYRKRPFMIAKKGKKAAQPERRGVQSIDVGLRILQVLAAHDSALPLKVISEQVDMAPSNVHRYLASFVRAGLLRQDPDTSRYDLGRLALQIGMSALSRLDIMELAPRELKKIAAEFGLLGVVVIFGDQGPTIVRFQQCSPPITISLGLGSIIPTLRSASGQLFVAFLPDEITRHVVEREFRSNVSYVLSSSTPRTSAEVRRLAERIRKQFYSVVEVDVSPGIRAIASPVLNAQGEATATLSLLGPDSRLGASHPALQALMHACGQLSREAGYRGEWPDAPPKS
jgi:DNA-binding IclR family transcriptional regulator